LEQRLLRLERRSFEADAEYGLLGDEEPHPRQPTRDWEAKANAMLPFGRLVDPAEAARAVNFLVSDDANESFVDTYRV
jgi:NAD(P)-dependent dehydrogenase (short-subunit alcohol dehydrogenase family)